MLELIANDRAREERQEKARQELEQKRLDAEKEHRERMEKIARKDSA